MAVIVVGTETSLQELEGRLFKRGASAATRERLRKAIRDENPDVDFDHLRRGQVLKLPRSPDLRADGDLSLDDSVKEAIGVVRERLKADLEDLGTAAQERLTNDAAARAVTAKQLDSAEVRAAAAQDDAVMAAVNSAAEGLDEDAAADDRRQAVVKQAIAEWENELDALQRLTP